MSFTVQTNEAEFRETFHSYLGRFPKVTSIGLRRVGKRLGARLMAFTPPVTMAQGMAAVARDIRRAVRPLSTRWANTFKDDRMRKEIRRIVEKRSIPAMEKVISRMKNTSLDGAQVHDSFDPAWHESARTKTGRVRTFGRFKSVKTQHVTFDVEAVGAYIRKKQGFVFMAKGGWAEGFLQLGGTTADAIARHRWAGSFIDQSYSNNVAWLEWSNKSPWALHNNNANIVAANALLSIERELERELAAELEKHGAQHQ
jgi:hypothetical protein